MSPQERAVRGQGWKPETRQYRSAAHIWSTGLARFAVATCVYGYPYVIHSLYPNCNPP